MLLKFFYRFPLKPSSKHKIYVWHGTLRGDVGAIVSLGTTDDGKLLASGGITGTEVWDLETMQRLRTPSNPGLRGGTTAIVWIKLRDDPGEALFYGTQAGYLVSWRQGPGVQDFEEVSCFQLVDPAEITGLAFDPLSNRVAVCHRQGVVQVYALDSSMNLRAIYSIKIPNCSAKSIAFSATHGISTTAQFIFSADLLAKLRRCGAIGGYIGDAAVDMQGSMCLDDPSCGVNVHRLEEEGQRKVKSFSIPMTKQMRARKVCFSNQCQEIVGGSDHGVMYVFDRRNGETVDELSIHESEWVQTVTATDCNGVPTILAAKSRDAAESNEIFIWHKKTGRTRGVGNRSKIHLQLPKPVRATSIQRSRECVRTVPSAGY
ncbi:WD40-repeat-containing domain protein [Mycena maculata]|uniref:WD40-repeat-containing domain protein n=1 Tax=Mycena maculata TaxID=230809 RepID=A0AAD7J1T6_9AGAR|nr:WD40-repeat-containing domain protein [Mycena maculata]